MSKISKLKKSRGHWKSIAIKRGKSNRYQRRENKRLAKERDIYKKRWLQSEELLSEKRREHVPPTQDKEKQIWICFQLFIIVRISFRAVSRVMEVLGKHLGIKKHPCTQTVINWITRLSITKIQRPEISVVNGCASPLSAECFWVIDTSIALGAGKILPILSLNIRHYEQNKGAPNLQQVKCVAVAVATSWTGEKIADFLRKVIKTVGPPVGFLKDGGSDLGKAADILHLNDFANFSISDISHFCANLLRHEYQNDLQFEIFITACGKVSAKLKQTVLACLAPPKVAKKAKFMNAMRLVKWAHQLLEHSPKGGAKKDSLLSKLRASLDELPACRAFIKRFLRDANTLQQCQKILKNKGLSAATKEECYSIIQKIPVHSVIHIEFVEWLEKQFKIATELGVEKAGMPVCSDIIETLFGVAKQHGTGEVKDAYRIALRIPALCGELTPQDAKRVMAVTVKEQKKVTSLLPSLVKQRRQVLPNPGSLDEIQVDEKECKFELIPRPEKRVNKEEKNDVLRRYKNKDGPPGRQLYSHDFMCNA